MAKILIVDDDRTNLRLLQQALEAEGYQTLTASSGPEALAAVRTADPDLILLDVLMPGMDGFQVCQQLREDVATSAIPVVLVTILADIQDRIRGNEVLADDFLSKPVDRLELVTRVQSLLRLRALQQDLKRSYEKTQELVQAKDRLTEMIVHDLKGPLTVLTSGVKHLASREEKRLSTMGKSLLEQATLSGTQLARMVENLLDITRMEEGRLPLQPEPFSLPTLVEECACAIHPLVVEGEIAMENRIPRGLPVAYGDREIIRRVVENLLHNAVKFTPARGWIRLDASPATLDRQRKPRPGLVVHVQDTGRGVPRGAERKIFEKFFQLEGDGCQERRGSGLGLTFCKMAVEAHGGEIWVESAEGRGSTFHFTLPAGASRG